jgi:hypothetical protein
MSWSDRAGLWFRDSAGVAAKLIGHSDVGTVKGHTLGAKVPRQKPPRFVDQLRQFRRMYLETARHGLPGRCSESSCGSGLYYRLAGVGARRPRMPGDNHSDRFSTGGELRGDHVIRRLARDFCAAAATGEPGRTPMCKPQ